MSEYMKQMIVGSVMVFIFSLIVHIYDVDNIMMYAVLWVAITMIVAVFIDNNYLFKG